MDFVNSNTDVVTVRWRCTRVQTTAGSVWSCVSLDWQSRSAATSYTTCVVLQCTCHRRSSRRLGNLSHIRRRLVVFNSCNEFTLLSSLALYFHASAANNRRWEALCIPVVCPAVSLSVRPLTSISRDAISFYLVDGFQQGCIWRGSGGLTPPPRKR